MNLPAITLLLTRLQSTLGPSLLGLYLYGSLASGDFDPATSDIDFLAVTDGPLTPEQIAAIEAMHHEIHSSGVPLSNHLEGAYLPASALPRFDPGDPTAYPTWNEGRFYLSTQGWDWVIQRHVLREWGVIVSGPPIRPLIDPVSPADMRQAVRGILHDWWEPMLADPAFLDRPLYRAYAVLSMCRALHCLETGEIVSKPRAARWAIETLGEPRAGLIRRALTWRPGDDFDDIPAVLEFIAQVARPSDP